MPRTATRPSPKRVPEHPHQWMIESPSGATSRGTCTVCGATKEFPNSAEDWLWERDVPKSRWTGRVEGDSDSY